MNFGDITLTLKCKLPKCFGLRCKIATVLVAVVEALVGKVTIEVK